jgi:hypothetical protein
MALKATNKSIQASREELSTISNRVAIALAKREKLIKSWTAPSACEKEPEKTQDEMDAEDAALFRKKPKYLGVGAPVPSQFLISDADRNTKSLRARFFPLKGLKASKQRDAEEKAASAKRGLNEESSDDEGGRSSLGKAKKQKTATVSKPAGPIAREDKATGDPASSMNHSEGLIKEEVPSKSAEGARGEKSQLKKGMRKIRKQNQGKEQGSLVASAGDIP